MIVYFKKKINLNLNIYNKILKYKFKINVFIKKYIYLLFILIYNKLIINKFT